MEGDAALYTALVGAFGRAGSHEDVLSSAKLVEGKGLADTGRIYSTAVASLLEGNLVAEARDLYDRAMQDGAEVGARGYEALVWGAALSQDPAQAAWQLLGMIDGLNAQALVRWGAGGDRGPVLARAVEGMLSLPRGALEAALES